MDPLLLIISGRVIERVLIVVSGIFIIWLGFKLFKIKSEEMSNFEYSSDKGFFVKLDKLGPGIFFAFFGSALLAYSMFTKIEITEEGLRPDSNYTQQGVPGVVHRSRSIRGLASDQGSYTSQTVPLEIQAVNTIVDVINRTSEGSESISVQGQNQLIRSIPYLVGFQKVFINDIFGAGVFEEYQEMELECKKSTRKCRDYRSDGKNSEKMDKIRELIGEKFD